MGRITAIRKFATIAIGEKVVIPNDRIDWGMGLYDCHPRLGLPADTQKNDEEDQRFRRFFIGLFPSGRGFANVTISILHELGHWATRHEVDWNEYWVEAENTYGWDYFNLKAERMATDWAINWLSDPENRKIAKAFEVEYFGH